MRETSARQDESKVPDRRRKVFMSPLGNVLTGDVSVSGWGEAPSWGMDSMVLAPSTGRWYPAAVELGEVAEGHVLGEVRMGASTVQVKAPCRGHVLDNLVMKGHPVEDGRPVVWMTRASNS
jgi:biotin carboxyl carrier protein